MISISFFACSTKEISEVIDESEDTPNYANVHIDGFYPGDEVTRSSLSYGKNGLEFTWTIGDAFGIFPTSVLDENGNRSNNNTNVSFVPFTLNLVETSGLKANITSDNSGFHFLSKYRYTAFTPSTSPSLITNAEAYNQIHFDFSNQTQRGYANMTAYYTNPGGGYSNNAYKESEKIACAHLSASDILISPETVSDDRPLQFHMRHIGAVSRCFIKTPVGKKLRIKEVKLIADQEIFYTRGFINLASHPYDENEKPSTTVPASQTDVKNYGVALPQAAESQITPDETSKTNCLTLKFDDGSTTEPHKGVWNQTDKNEEYGRYLLAYFMMYPINYDNTQASAFIYVTADDENGNEVYYRTSKKLASKYMCSGYVYQWTNTPDDIHPIELTATLLPWQDIVADGINTDLEK